jgi:3-isopropylmalate/(R)-2-methylmalate dehydratase large subunit
MGMTLAEKILANKSAKNKVQAGEIVEVDVDIASIIELASPFVIAEFERFKRPVWDKDKVTGSVCHFPASKVDAAVNIKQLKDFCKKQGIKNFFPYAGPLSFVLLEQGFVRPGIVIVGTDSHTVTDGAFGAFATGIGTTDMVGVMLTGRIWFKVPSTIKFVVDGELPRGVMTKDLILKMISIVGVSGANYKAVEYTGDTVQNMGMDGRMVLANMTAEMGGKVGLIAVDKKAEVYLKKLTKRPFQTLQPDPDAKYEKVVAINASQLEPMIACPHSPGNVNLLSQVEPVKLDQGLIGTCNGGRMDDLREAAKILKGKKVHPDMKLIVIPATPDIYNQALDEGLVNIFAKAGALMEYANCGPCLGTHMGLLAPGEVCISTANRNFPGRMGGNGSSVYLASPATVAASAIEGRITDPRKYL